jgi:hypothetical protein
MRSTTFGHSAKKSISSNFHMKTLGLPSKKLSLGGKSEAFARSGIDGFFAGAVTRDLLFRGFLSPFCRHVFYRFGPFPALSSLSDIW